MLSIRESAKFVGTQPQKGGEVLSIILGCVFGDLPVFLAHVVMGNASLSALSPGQSPHTGQTSLTSDPEKQKDSLYVPVTASDRSKKRCHGAALYSLKIRTVKDQISEFFRKRRARNALTKQST
ncbi:hypothetical protein CC77DRAFT_539159 [Alternaria alternata]|jgi:hypothetical protein|uniref:Uncharacterized protein n=1 Tax=Alternaria alternata TaxID=5599 RepID=A0A177DY64_ALTAL|nr:hypothetical protein CC77DRAFT_539159 [Alternaria alternata]OAG24653.1 hypothetical protein CC77DRAFT_539159 [Alternaria alternata]